MKVGIHLNGGNSFSKRWVEYCISNGISYKLVNAYSSNVIEQLHDCDYFMWHFSQNDDLVFAKQLLFSLQKMGKKVFPNFDTCWHFDDKVGQKYLLEAINAPLVKSHVFYSEKDALEWVKMTSFPKVLKLRGGAASTNVKLIHNEKEAKQYIKLAFSSGIPHFDPKDNLKEKKRLYDDKKINIKTLLGAYYRLMVQPRSKTDYGYVYFQDFIPNNSFDIRVVVTGNKAVAIKRLCRKDDFRASGGGYSQYDRDAIDERCVKIAFEVNKKLKSQSVAYDFIFDECNNPLIVEISYGYVSSIFKGYWDENMTWVQGECTPQYWQLENLLRQ